MGFATIRVSVYNHVSPCQFEHEHRVEVNAQPTARHEQREHKTDHGLGRAVRKGDLRGHMLHIARENGVRVRIGGPVTLAQLHSLHLTI